MTGGECWEPDCTQSGAQTMPWSCPRCGATGRAELCGTHDNLIRTGRLRPLCDKCADNGRLFQRLTLDAP